MAALHQLTSTSLSQWLSSQQAHGYTTPADVLLVTGSAVVELLNDDLLAQVNALQLQPKALSSDVEALGLTQQLARVDVDLVTDADWVELTLSHHPLYSW